MLLGLGTALVASVCFGFAAVFQSRAACSAPRADRVRVGPLAALVRSWRFAVGTLLDLVAFMASAVAVRALPLFLVQAVTNASLAVTAVAAVRLLDVRLRRADVAGILAVVLGLTLLAFGSGPEGRNRVAPSFHWVLLGVSTVILLAALVLVRRTGRVAVACLGLLAGAGFGMISLVVRVVDVSGPVTVLLDPAAYALVVGGIGGYLAFALALQRGAVTAVTAAGMLTETFGPAVVGVTVFGDAARPGLAWCALTGFATAVGGTALLSRFGEPHDGSAGRTGARREPGPPAAVPPR
ncbi:hypothetical protein [Kitasatospora sp. NPDC058046]|uniref:hypothetical protein n=1 Tax=Kitasatospora sp. NPDC058046 TaxID=3346312 RepID=UPI0036D8B3C8